MIRFLGFMFQLYAIILLFRDHRLIIKFFERKDILKMKFPYVKLVKFLTDLVEEV